MLGRVTCELAQAAEALAPEQLYSETRLQVRKSVARYVLLELTIHGAGNIRAEYSIFMPQLASVAD